MEPTWALCPFYGGPGECAEFEVPADWGHSDGEHITLFVRRLGDATDGQQIWLLAGGPGSSGDAQESMGQLLYDADPSVNVYVLDHRGTGRSSRLGCPEQEAEDSDGGSIITMSEYPDCIANVQAPDRGH